MENIKENINNEDKNENVVAIIEQNQEQLVQHERQEDYTLKVRGGDVKSPDASQRPTDPIGLSRSILHVLEGNPLGFCKINSVGPIALSSAMAGFRLASIAYSARTKGSVLVMTQSEYTAIVAGSKTRGVCTRIFPIPVNYQV